MSAPPVADEGPVRAERLREAGRYDEATATLEAWLAHRPDDAAAHAALAQLRLIAGQDAAARASLDVALSIDPASPAARRTLARLKLREGRVSEAVAAAEAAWTEARQDPESQLVLATALLTAEDHSRAAKLVEAAIEARPDYAEAFVMRAQLRARAGDLRAGLADAETALRIKPHLPIHATVGTLRLRLGDVTGAVASYEAALAVNPRDVAALVRLGDLQRRSGRADAAAALLRRAVEAAPGNADAWLNLGMALQQRGDLPAARTAYGSALEADPNLVEALINLGRVLRDERRPDEAEASYRRALSIRQDLPEAHYGLAGILKSQSRFAEARAAYEQALALNPGLGEAWSALADVLNNEGDIATAKAGFEAALARAPSLAGLMRARLLLAPIASSNAETAALRAAYVSGIEEAMRAEGTLDRLDLVPDNGAFYLAYQGMDDRPVMEALAALYAAKAPGLVATAPHLADWRPPAAAGRRIKVAFVSEYLCNHTIGRLFEGLIRELDRTRFEVVVAHTPKSRPDAVRARIDAAADRAVALPHGLEAQRRRLASEAPDVLLYPDIGMSQASYLLGHARLAPVQAVSWGHPDTTGLPAIDYFLSSDLIEPPGAEDHYTERLVRLDRLPCFYPAPEPTAPGAGRGALGLPDAGALYGCPQSLFKIHPDFDPVLAQIVGADPDGWLVFLEGRGANWTRQLRARWAETAPGLNDRVLFAPRMPNAAFLQLLAQMDVLLDPIHFGSGNTLYEAMATGAPVVTWPGPFARGRVVAGAYRQMGVAGAPIAERLEDYAPLAVGLGRDAERRRELRDALKEAAARSLYADRRAVRSVERFLSAAVEAAGRGAALPRGSRPDTEPAA